MPAHRRSFPDGNNNVSVEEEEEEEEEEEKENHSLSLLRPRKQSRFLQQPPNEHHSSRDPPSQQEEKEQEDGQRGQEEVVEEEEEEEQAEGEEEEEEEGAGEEEEEEEEEEGEEEEQQEEEEEEDDDEEERKDSDEEESSESDDKSEFVYVELPEVRKDVQCPICLGIIKKTRTVMECLHRFCRECIDKSMRLGNNECPACRTHCASRRSLRDDPNFDALISVLFPDIDKYEEEELAFQEEERIRNKQIQASIAQVMQRQSEALSKRRTLGKDAVGGLIMRSQSNIHSRRKRNTRMADPQGSEDNENENNNNNVKDSSSADERITEVRPRKRQRRRTATRPSQPSSSADGGGIENDLEGSRERRGISPGLVWNPEMFAWGRGGTRSHTRYGSANGSSKSFRSNRLSKLVDHLQSREENDEANVHFALISLDKKRIPDLDKPYFCSRLNLSVRHLCDYVARKLQLAHEKMEMCLVRGHNKFTTTLSNSVGGIDSLLMSTGSLNYDMQIVNGEETLATIEANSAEEYLILGYREKKAEIS